MADFSEDIERFLASFSSEDLAVMRHAFRAILAGRPAKVGELAAAVGLPPAAVHETVERLTARGTLVVEPGTAEITGARGLSLSETRVRSERPGRMLSVVEATALAPRLWGMMR